MVDPFDVDSRTGSFTLCGCERLEACTVNSTAPAVSFKACGRKPIVNLTWPSEWRQDTHSSSKRSVGPFLPEHQ